MLALSAQVATAQSSSGNIVTGEAKVEMISTYDGSEALAKPEKVMIQDFTPVGDIIMDESAAARLHRRLSLKHGSDEDSTPQVLTQQVQPAFSKTLMEEFTKLNVQSGKFAERYAEQDGPFSQKNNVQEYAFEGVLEDPCAWIDWIIKSWVVHIGDLDLRVIRTHINTGDSI